MTKTKDLSEFTVNSRIEKFYFITQDVLWQRADLTISHLMLYPIRLSELSTEKIIEMFVQANPRKF